jgi:hypothetical protein
MILEYILCYQITRDNKKYINPDKSSRKHGDFGVK